MNCGIYEILNTVNGKRYVGSAVRFEKRFAVHLHHLRRGNHHSKYLQSSWNKYGEPAFRFNRILVCSKANAVFFEQRAINVLKPEYNVCRIAGSCLGVKHSVETSAKRSALNIGNKFALGRIPSIETRAKWSAQRMGRDKGKKRNPNAIAATAAAHRGMKRSAETRAKIAAKAKGRIWSTEAKAKLSATLSGRKMAPEHITHLLGNKFAAGHKPTSEESARRSASLKAAWAERKAAGIPWR